jgi:hypothetical protein
MDEDLHRVRVEIAAARANAGLGYEVIGRACHVAASTVSRTLSGRIAHPDPVLLAAIGASVGLDLRLRAYVGGDPIRDIGQQRLLERLRRRLSGVRWLTEVPLPTPGDRRAWDALIVGPAWRIAVEAETVLDDLQALERRIALKQRDGDMEHVVLLVAQTRRNRRVLDAAPAAFGSFSRDARTMLRALSRGATPGTSGIVIL